MKTSLLFVLRENAKSTKTNKTPIVARLLHNRKKTEKVLLVSLNESEIHLWNPITQRLNKRESHINDYLSKIEDTYNKLLSKLASTINNYDSLQLMESIFPDSKKEEENISFLFEKYFLNKVASSSVLKSGTKRNYRKSINHFQNFI